MSNLHDKHRQRMDEKAAAAGVENLPDHEVLERLLYVVIPRGNTNEIAKRLCNEFGGIGNVFKADVDELKRIEGVGNRVAIFLHDLPAVLGVVERSLKFPEKKIQSRKDAAQYVKTLFYGKVTEHFYMVSLTSTGGVIKFNKISEGTTDETQVYIRNIAVTALRNGAHSVILAHNHPGGSLMPSFEDTRTTSAVERALSTIGVKLFDSIIVAGGEGRSILHE